MSDLRLENNTLDQMQAALASLPSDFDQQLIDAAEQCPSLLDTTDYCFAITIGSIAALLDTNEKLTKFLDVVHQHANQDKHGENAFQNFLSDALHHSGDWMDAVPVENTKIPKSVRRGAKHAANQNWIWSSEMKYGAPHRVFWGHDIFSFKEDNPFRIMVQQQLSKSSLGKSIPNPVFSGVTQALRHLIADTCSVQGCPMPGHSWADYIDQYGVTRNHLLDFCNHYIKSTPGLKASGFNNIVFNTMFSIHMQDIMSSGLVFASVAAYGKLRKIQNVDRMVQMRVIAYGINFFAPALQGCLVNGVPKIDWPCFLALTKNICQMLHRSTEQIQELIHETDQLVLCRDELQNRQMILHNQVLNELNTSLRHNEHAECAQSLINFFGEET